MSYIEYTVTVSPEKPGAEISLSATPTSLTATIEKIDDISLKVEPKTGTIVAGAVTGAILGLFVGGPAFALLAGGAGIGTVFAVAAIIQKEATQQLKNQLDAAPKSETHDFDHPLGYSINVGGVEVKAGLSTVQLGTYQSMLMITGDIKVD